MDLDSSLGLIKGVGPKTLEILENAGLRTVKDILHFFPRKYEDFATIVNLSELRPGKVLFRATVEKVNIRRVRRGMTIVEAILTDGKEKVRSIWFNQPYRVNQLKIGEEFFFSGVFELSYNRYQVSNPQVMKQREIPKGENFQGENGEIVPIYRQKKGLKTEIVRKILTELKPLMKILPETLPEKIIKKENLISRSQAIEWIHFPGNFREFELALDRLSFEEIFEIVFASKLNKIENLKLSGYKIGFDNSVIKEFVANLPFELTNSQRLASWEIIQDMKNNTPMNRLLQGDVGSGKTVVSAISALNAVRAGFQVALVAPTEILAFQHAESFSNFLKETGVRVGFLSGSVKGKARKTLYENLQKGKIDILIGTHAVLQEEVKFLKLGLVIIDEQHRFGVEQRQKLLEKSDYKMPHLLSMTATPIPRSLQLTLFGDLDISILKDKPKGRKTIKTEIISPVSRKKMIEKVKREILNGRQVFVIVPAILDGKNEEIKSVESEFKRLSRDFPRNKIAKLHGKMKSAEKDEIMKEFIDKKFEILLSTTVIEVGVDVPNASVIVIENADRFGLSQLHQLRGRVGRGNHESYCFLVMSSTSKPPQRLIELEKSDDGFILAEKDLHIRGAGEIYGTAQSGELNLEFASLGDVETINRAQQAVDYLFEDGQNFEKYTLNNAKKLQKYQRLTILN